MACFQPAAALRRNFTSRAHDPAIQHSTGRRRLASRDLPGRLRMVAIRRRRRAAKPLRHSGLFSGRGFRSPTAQAIRAISAPAHASCAAPATTVRLDRAGALRRRSANCPRCCAMFAGGFFGPVRSHGRADRPLHSLAGRCGGLSPVWDCSAATITNVKKRITGI